MSGDHDRLRMLAQCCVPFLGILALALLVFAGVHWLEAAPGRPFHPLDWLRDLDSRDAMGRLASAAEVVAGVLAVAITVVAIVVELAANRYTHRITALFVREPVNAGVLGFFVLTTILTLWISMRPGPGDAAGVFPQAGLVASLAMVSICLLLLIPYFAFVFRFLAPENVIRTLGRQALRPILRVRSDAPRRRRHLVIDSVEELADVARGALAHGDRNVAVDVIHALADLLREYEEVRNALPEAWYELDGAVGRDPDFVSMDSDAAEAVRNERLWLETKVMRQYLALFTESVGKARDVTNVVALDTRALAEEYAHGNPAFADLCARALNSYVRAAINGADQRTAYYVLRQMSLLGQASLARHDDEGAIAIADHLHEYGRLAFERGQTFLLEVVAYDVATLVERAVQLERPAVDALLTKVLEVDLEEEPSARDEERLRGVRRAQVRLATFFLERDDERRARRIQLDMAHERPERLAAIRDALSSETRARYWELTDRGVNFVYLPPGRRRQLDRFFSWFEALQGSGARGSSPGEAPGGDELAEER